MAIFTKDETEKLNGRITTAAGDGAMSIVAQGMKVVGDIESNGVVKIEGLVEGTVRAARQVLLGRQGEVKGDVHARDVVVGGRIDGSIVASERVEIQGTSSVNGDIYTKSIVVLEGGKINGAVRMEESASARSSDDDLSVDIAR